MDKTIRHPVYGVIRYDENIWTGKRTLAINGTILRKAKKNIYTLGEGESAIPVTLKGNALTGVSVMVQGQEIVILPKPSALEYILSFLPFALIIIWSNNPVLCSIIPVVGGAIGGAVGGAGMVACLCMIREKPAGEKVLTGLLTTLFCFMICAALGYVLVTVLMAGSM